MLRRLSSFFSLGALFVDLENTQQTKQQWPPLVSRFHRLFIWKEDRTVASRDARMVSYRGSSYPEEVHHARIEGSLVQSASIGRVKWENHWTYAPSLFLGTADWMYDWLNVWLSDWVTEWLTDSTDWLIDCYTCVRGTVELNECHCLCHSTALYINGATISDCTVPCRAMLWC